MSVQYNKLWELLNKKKMKKIELQRTAGLSGNILARLGHDEYVSMETVEKICKTLNCTVDEILQFK